MKLSAVLAASWLGATGWASTVKEGGEAPNVAGTWFNYEQTTLKDLRGMAVLIEFWGTH